MVFANRGEVRATVAQTAGHWPRRPVPCARTPTVGRDVLVVRATYWPRGCESKGAPPSRGVVPSTVAADRNRGITR
jgi:hypothetical protein